MTYRIGDDPSGQTIYDGDQIVAVGCTPEAAATLVDRMNSAPVRQEDIDLLLWLLAEKTHLADWYHRTGEIERASWNKAYDRVVEERDSARTALAFWGVVS